MLAWPTNHWIAFFILGSAAATAQLFRVQTPRDQAYHTAIVFLVAAAFVLPPELVALMGIVQHIPEWLKIRYRWYLQTFNICNYVLGSMAVWFLAHHIMGWTVISDRTLRVATAGLVCCVVFVAINHTVLALMLHFARGHTLRETGLFDAEHLATDLGLTPDAALRLTETLGLLAGVLLIAGFYRLGIQGAHSVGGNIAADRLRMSYVHSLVPIAAVYVAAHYLTFLIFEGQAINYLASDPFGQGWDLFGTVTSGIDYSIFPQKDTWYVQVAFVVVGHVAALTLAHDRALTLYGDARLAVRSQYWMLGIMVGFTSLALWLLAQAGT